MAFSAATQRSFQQPGRRQGVRNSDNLHSRTDLTVNHNEGKSS